MHRWVQAAGGSSPCTYSNHASQLQLVSSWSRLILLLPIHFIHVPLSTSGYTCTQSTYSFQSCPEDPPLLSHPWLFQPWTLTVHTTLTMPLSPALKPKSSSSETSSKQPSMPTHFEKPHSPELFQIAQWRGLARRVWIQRAHDKNVNKLKIQLPFSDSKHSLAQIGVWPNLKWAYSGSNSNPELTTGCKSHPRSEVN